MSSGIDHSYLLQIQCQKGKNWVPRYSLRYFCYTLNTSVHKLIIGTDGNTNLYSIFIPTLKMFLTTHYLFPWRLSQPGSPGLKQLLKKIGGTDPMQYPA